ncbi:MAG: hypothetical protein R3C17_02620 [Planctomycetaceae bacterium]
MSPRERVIVSARPGLEGVLSPAVRWLTHTGIGFVGPPGLNRSQNKHGGHSPLQAIVMLGRHSGCVPFVLVVSTTNNANDVNETATSSLALGLIRCG